MCIHSFIIRSFNKHARTLYSGCILGANVYESRDMFRRTSGVGAATLGQEGDGGQGAWFPGQPSNGKRWVSSTPKTEQLVQTGM